MSEEVTLTADNVEPKAEADEGTSKDEVVEEAVKPSYTEDQEITEGMLTETQL